MRQAPGYRFMPKPTVALQSLPQGVVPVILARPKMRSEDMSNPVAWFELYVEDMDRARHFYESLLKISLEQLSDPTGSGAQMWSFPSDFTQYGACGALVKMEGFSPGPGGSMVYFSCEDCAVEEARVEAAGGKVQQAKMAIGEFGFCSMVMDTEGNMIGLHSEK